MSQWPLEGYSRASTDAFGAGKLSAGVSRQATVCLGC